MNMLKILFLIGSICFVSEALFAEIIDGQIIYIHQGPSSERHCADDGTSSHLWEKFLSPIRITSKFYKEASKNFILTPSKINKNPKAISKSIQRRYDKLIGSQLAQVREIKIDRASFIMCFPENYYENEQPIEIKAEALKISAFVPDEINRRILQAYILNSDKGKDSIVFAINGHFGFKPSGEAIGLINNGGYSGAILAKLAIKGFQVITYDDSRNNLDPADNFGESWASNHKGDGIVHTLEDLKIIDQALLRDYQKVHAIGLSGGAERLGHYLMFHNSRLQSAYIAGWVNPLWMRGDGKREKGNPRRGKHRIVFGVDPDTDSRNNVLEKNFQNADLIFVGIFNDVRIALAQNTLEGALAKVNLDYEVIPLIEKFTHAYSKRGNDADGDGVSDSGPPLCHEYDEADLIDWLYTQTEAE